MCGLRPQGSRGGDLRWNFIALGYPKVGHAIDDGNAGFAITTSLSADVCLSQIATLTDKPPALLPAIFLEAAQQKSCHKLYKTL